ncbi:MAG: tRNA pseudouridine synthase A, partial [Candidatus Margulisiibacteriota bacterium]
MRNIKLTLAYDGTNFCGFELQPGKRSIRREIEKALFKIFKTRVKIINASRTDARVHALCQVINFRIKSSIPTSRIAAALNSCLPEEIRVIKAREQARGFHARYSPKTKVYEYLIYNGEILPPFYRKLVWHVKPKLDLAAMRKAAKVLQGKHDFSSFCASGSDDKNFVKTL